MMEMMLYYQELSSYIAQICSEVLSCCQRQEALYIQKGLQDLQAQIQKQIMEMRMHGS